MVQVNAKHICIVGHGTAGLIAALILKNTFPSYRITVIYSKNIGIIGVGEGSTEHWRLNFMDPLGINSAQMVAECAATHKYGLLFKGWTKSGPDYFHSISGKMDGPIYFPSTYAFALENNWPLTQAMVNHLHDDTVPVVDPNDVHKSVNQFHFDTFRLNNYLDKLARNRGVLFVEGEITNINRNTNNGFIESVVTKTKEIIPADFFIDASGFKRVLMSGLLDNDEFISFSDYLPCDSAAVFQTELDESGKIHPYTKAQCMPNGWMWEIPTQYRKGNGYVFASAFCSDDQAVREISLAHKKDIVPARVIKYKTGYYKHGIAYNCVAIGLSSSFVEPLEATSIGASIQQSRMLASLLPTFNSSTKAQVMQFQKQHHSLMENILTMIALHYVSDRDDTEMWRNQQRAPKPALLEYLLSLWQERCPEQYDVPHFGYEMFHSAHLWHVAQGQGVLSPTMAAIQLDAYQSRSIAARYFAQLRSNTIQQTRVPHAAIFKTR